VSDQTYALRVERVIGAAQEPLFDAWTTPSLLQQWLHPAEDWSTPVADTDARVGGRYRWGVRSPEGATFYEVGEFLEVVRPERLVYTCSFEDEANAFDMPQEEHVVRVSFERLAEGTRVVVVQEGYLKGDQRDAQAQGWPAFLDQLTKLVVARLSARRAEPV